jgi:hypothetical protein
MINSVEKKYVDGIFDNYKMTLSDGKVWLVPLDPANSDYQAIQEWIQEGNTVIDNGGNN